PTCLNGSKRMLPVRQQIPRAVSFTGLELPIGQSWQAGTAEDKPKGCQAKQLRLALHAWSLLGYCRSVSYHASSSSPSIIPKAPPGAKPSYYAGSRPHRLTGNTGEVFHPSGRAANYCAEALSAGTRE